MDGNIDGALEDILIIKNSIEKTKSNYTILYKIFMIYGIVNLISNLPTTIELLMLKPSEIPVYFNLISNITIYIFFLIFYIKIFKNEKISSNKYYISFLSIFAGVSFLLPLILYAIRTLIGLTSSGEKIGSSFIYLESLSMMSNILLLCFCIIISGYILKKRGMLLISSVVLFIFLILSSIYNNIGYTIIFSDYHVNITLLSVYYRFLESFGYIIMAMVLKYAERTKNGAK